MGAGTGFLGMYLAKTGLAESVILTDGTPGVVANLKENYRANTMEAPLPVDIELIDWDTPSDRDWNHDLPASTYYD